MCIFKWLTGYPCPGCGSTRALISLLHGDIKQSLWYNPVVFILIICGFVLAFVSLIEYAKTKGRPIYKEMTVYKIFHQSLSVWVIVIAVIFTILNWAWNIHKGI